MTKGLTVNDLAVVVGENHRAFVAAGGRRIGGAELKTQGRVKIDQDEWLILDSDPEYPGQDTYDIAPDRYNTYAKCFEWIAHLSRKTWMTPDMMWDMVVLMADRLEGIKAKSPDA